MKTFQLQPTNGRASFGNKCHVCEYESKGVTYSELISFGTLVARYNHNENTMQVFGWFSATTAIHINHFLEFYGFNKATKEQMKKWNQSQAA